MESSKDKQAYGQFTKPFLAELLQKLNLDYEVLHAEGNKMQIRHRDGEETEVRDFVGGYGANLLGHNHPAILNAIKAFYQNRRTNQAQLSFRNKSGELSERLCELAMDETGEEFIAVLGNTGAEAIEIALRHAKLGWKKKFQHLIEKGVEAFQRADNYLLQNALKEERQQLQAQSLHWQESIKTTLKSAPLQVIYLENSYHGKTSAALSVSDTYDRSEAGNIKLFFDDLEDIKFDFGELSFYLPHWHSNEIKMQKHKLSCIYAVIAEPLQGEGGVRLLKPSEAASLKQLAEKLDCPLIWDEIQSGCYRTGSLFYSSKMVIHGDYYCLGKALGAGVAKISAVLIKRSLYLKEFDLMHNSTFGEDDFSAEMGINFLALKSDIQQKIVEIDPAIQELLGRVQKRFPNIIREIRGAGLLYGVEFEPRDFSGSYSLQAISRSGFFNYILVAYLLNEEGIRCSAPLSKPYILRFHFDLSCNLEDLNKLEIALNRLCDILDKQDVYQLIRYKLPQDLQRLRLQPENFKQKDIPDIEEVSNLPKVGFITHYIDYDNVRKADPSLAILPDESIKYLLIEFFEFLPPILNGSRIVSNVSGNKVRLSMIGMAYTSDMAKEAMLSRKMDPLRKKVQESVDLLEKYDVDVIGLGQYSSILSRNGKGLTTSRAVLTTGNGLTVYLAAQSLLEMAAQEKVDLIKENMALVGGFGNIGSCLLKLLEKKVQKAMVFTSGRNAKQSLENSSSDLNELINYRLIMVATNSPEILIRENNTAENAIISDVSVPGNVDPLLIKKPANRKINMGGMACLPDGLGIPGNSFPLPGHIVFACLSETMVIGLSGRYDLSSLGELAQEKVNELGSLAEELGFKVYVG